MNSEEITPAPSPSGEQQKLPDLNTTILNIGEVEQLLSDIEQFAQVTEIIPKFAARDHVQDTSSITVQQARELLASRGVRGLQLRYRYENADWWDTLMVSGDRFRVVRIRHDFDLNERPSDLPR